MVSKIEEIETKDNAEIIKLRDSKPLIEQYLELDDNETENVKINVISNDNKLKNNDIKYMKSHNESFDRLLKTYVDNADKNLQTKLKFKKTFFRMCVWILSLIFSLLFITTIVCFFIDLPKETLLAIMITNILSFLTSFIVLPNTIATYLFNSDEEKNMTELIKSIQEYDKSIRKEMEK